MGRGVPGSCGNVGAADPTFASAAGLIRAERTLSIGPGFFAALDPTYESFTLIPRSPSAKRATNQGLSKPLVKSGVSWGMVMRCTLWSPPM